jgi:hypothetical protein
MLSMPSRLPGANLPPMMSLRSLAKTSCASDPKECMSSIDCTILDQTLELEITLL